MTRWNDWSRGGALLAAALMLALVAAAPEATPGGLGALVGAGDPLGWVCGVCAGRAVMVALGGMTSIMAFLFLSTNLVTISGCVTACASWLTT